ncbi:MAG: hypothetical protein LBS69_08575 [Prevotellaceae bacterium]|nr:hypothetical protein [Prevotellaceae bacterium]
MIRPDGAGKTSLFHILATLLLAEEGTATVDGLDVSKIVDIRNYIRRKDREYVALETTKFS